MTAESPFTYRDGELHCEEVAARLVAERHGTPCYVYSAASLVGRYRRIRDAFAAWEPLVCFSVKSCANLSVLRLLAGEGSGFDVVSGGELYRALLAGADPRKIVFAGAGKTEAEIEQALDAGILMFNVESAPELAAIDRAARRRGERARVALRINPDVDPGTHEKTTTGKGGTKFGIGVQQAERLAREAAAWPGVEVRGLHFHLGSPIYSAEPYERALQVLLPLVERLRAAGLAPDTLNLGGGWCISYTGEDVPGPERYAEALRSGLEKSACPVIIIEPGRYIAGNSAILLTRVVYRKESQFGKTFLICDAAMNDLIRPTLYGAFHRVWPVESPDGMPAVIQPERQAFEGRQTEPVDVVGPVCETGDFLARGRPVPRVEAGGLLAVLDAGAYGFVMSSNYNGRPRAAEVMVDGAQCRLIRRRETYDELVAPEQDLPD